MASGSDRPSRVVTRPMTTPGAFVSFRGSFHSRLVVAEPEGGSQSMGGAATWACPVPGERTVAMTIARESQCCNVIGLCSQLTLIGLQDYDAGRNTTPASGAGMPRPAAIVER